MSYQTETMGVAEGTALVFILLLPRVTLNSFTMVIAQTGQLSWLYLLVNGLAVLAIAGVLVYVRSKVTGDIYDIMTIVFGKKAAYFAMLLFISIFFANAVLLTRQYAEYTLITALPDMDLHLSIMLYVLGAVFTGYFGLSAVARCSVIFMPLMIAAFLGVTLLLYPFYIPYQLLPWQGYGLGKCIVQGLKGAGYNVGFLAVFILAPALQNNKTIKLAVIKGIALSVLLKVFDMIIFLMVFGVLVGSEKDSPFFELARLIYLGRFFQHIEALFIIVWVILGTLAIAINLFLVAYLCGRLFNLPAIRPIMPCLAVLMIGVALLPENIMQAVVLDTGLVYFDDILIYIIPLLLLGGILAKQMKGTLWKNA